MKAMINDMGIVSTMIKVALHRPRKMMMTRTTKKNAHIRVSERLLMDPLMNLEVSMIMSIPISGGSPAFSASIVLLISRVTFTVLAPDCFMAKMRNPCSPFTRSSSEISRMESLTTATSFR